MRTVSAILIVLALAGTASADELPTTRDVVSRHAASARRTRIVGGVAMVASGVALGAAGYYMVDNAHGFLSEIDEAYGYTMLAAGGLLALTGPVWIFRRSDVERTSDDLTDEQDARHARTEIAHRAKRARGTRMVVRGIGATLAGLGAAGALTSVVAADSLDAHTRNELMGAGIALGLWGVGFVAASFIESRWETMQRELGPGHVPLSAGLVPVRGGFVAGIGGAF